MTDYDYLNARIRGMSTELLSVEFYSQVLAVEGCDVLIDALLNSPYGPALRESLLVQPGPRAAESALRRNLFDGFAKVRSLAPEEPNRLLRVQFLCWDVRNVQAVLRGKLAEAPGEQIVSALFPAGELDEARLLELIDQPDAVAVTDTLTAWGFPFAYELRRAVREVQDLPADSVRIETALTEAFFDWALGELSGQDEDAALVRTQLQRQIDLVNVMAILHTVRQREAGKTPEAPVPIRGGRLVQATLGALAACTNLEGAFEELATTYFGAGVERGILAFGGQRRLGVMERSLERVVLEAGCRLFRTYPLGIGVVAGYLWRKLNEFLNLRILLRGKMYGRPTVAIREELFVVQA